MNDKIYDIRVEMRVKDADQLKLLKLKLIPVEYDYFISSYGMRQEDYPVVFPNEKKLFMVSRITVSLLPAPPTNSQAHFRGLPDNRA